MILSKAIGEGDVIVALCLFQNVSFITPQFFYAFFNFFSGQVRKLAYDFKCISSV